MKKKVLIIGANGFIGHRLLSDFSQKTDYVTYGSSLHKDISPQPDNYHFFCSDICRIKDLDHLFQSIKPDIVINTSALSVPDYCELHHEEAERINITAVENMARYCEKLGSRFIHLSTDFVFRGNTTRLYTEEDQPDPVNYYGFTKLKSEKCIAEICSNYVIVRVAVVYGASLPNQHGNILQLVANRLKSGQTIRVVSDQWRTPTFVGDITQGIEKLVPHPYNGIYHICGAECVTIAEIAYRVANILKLDDSLIVPLTSTEMNEATPRPLFSGLSIDKARKELEYKPCMLNEGITRMFGLTNSNQRGYKLNKEIQ
ncbi:MAG: NAD(P)-dependent oxidoreductase [Bacteroides sp.]|jgi:dTDP-4-dehydrorhamnose reductase|nr:NAD(P)-dependent oxidoreductase [Bacteroides sp.]MCI1682972.1 NAD(P)-dependent oxidoreductase [Bacteroides sp.]